MSLTCLDILNIHVRLPHWSKSWYLWHAANIWCLLVSLWKQCPLLSATWPPPMWFYWTRLIKCTVHPCNYKVKQWELVTQLLVGRDRILLQVNLPLSHCMYYIYICSFEKMTGRFCFSLQTSLLLVYMYQCYLLTSSLPFSNFIVVKTLGIYACISLWLHM